MNELENISIKSRGYTVNRPRYTVDASLILSLLIAYLYCYGQINEELPDGMPLLPHLSLTMLYKFYVFIRVTGGALRNDIEFVELKQKCKDVYDAFLRVTELEYYGLSKYNLNNMVGVLHPVDNFLKHMYDRYYPAECVYAFRTYKRTNPTLPLKCNYLEKFAKPNVSKVPVSELEEATDSVLSDVFNHKHFNSLLLDINNSVNNKDFDSVDLDLSSAAGFPYKQGVKKRDVEFEAKMCADNLMEDNDAFTDYMSEHVWYTTGRAKMQGIDDDDAGRLIVYGGFAYLLIAMLVIQPWSRFMNITMDWCAVGMSWMDKGANKFAEYFEADAGFAPKGYRYVSLDISSWDSKLHTQVMRMLIRFYTGLLSKTSVKKGHRKKFIAVVEGMITALILMPLGRLFKVYQGMRSGWAGTANDNTLLHEIIFRCVMKTLCYMKHKLYGDDNFILVPDSVTDQDIIDGYARFGLVVKVIHSSRYIGDVDFLSKHIHYRDGNYYVFREAVETHSRLLMPEEADPRRRDRPDVIIATERVLGHLLDNPFNTNVRKICYDLLERFKRDYEVLSITIDDEMFRRHPWRKFDRALIPNKFPTVPPMVMIEELYGVPIPSHLKVNWPPLPNYIHYDSMLREDNTLAFDASWNLSNDVVDEMSKLGKKQYKALIRRMSPYKQPVNCYGFHAARLEFAIKYFGIKFNNVLDFGSHPGACAASFAKYCSDITCVTLIPDKDRDVCPYVARGPEYNVIICDVNKYKCYRPFDLLHDDVDYVDSKTDDKDLHVGLGMIRRAIANVNSVNQALFTIKVVDWRVYEELYKAYVAYGHIDFVKPLFSNPWKCEFMVYLRKFKGPRKRKRVFNQSFNAFLNSFSPQLFEWSKAIISALTAKRGIGEVIKYPLQTDQYEKEWIKEWDSDRNKDGK